MIEKSSLLPIIVPFTSELLVSRESDSFGFTFIRLIFPFDVWNSPSLKFKSERSILPLLVSKDPSSNLSCESSTFPLLVSASTLLASTSLIIILLLLVSKFKLSNTKFSVDSLPLDVSTCKSFSLAFGTSIVTLGLLFPKLKKSKLKPILLLRSKVKVLFVCLMLYLISLLFL